MRIPFPTLIPWPASIELFNGSFYLQPFTRIVTNFLEDQHKAVSTVGICLEQLNRATGFSLKIDDSFDGTKESPASIVKGSTRTVFNGKGDTVTSGANLIEFFLGMDEKLEDLVGEDLSLRKIFVEWEAYALVVDSVRIRILAIHEPGLYYACQTLRQLLPPQALGTFIRESLKENNASGRAINEPNFWSVPLVRIYDKPRFEYRGVMLDVGRHFMPKDFVLKLIDVISTHKLNRFHWHLTEDQGWRIEIKKYPRLTQFGSYRRHTLKNHAGWPEDQWVFDQTPHAGFYTQDDVREIVTYAEKRHVVVVPEIEMPGHSQAAIAAYPDLGNRKDILEAIERNGAEKPKNFPLQLEVHAAWGVNPNIYNVKDSTLDFLKDVLTEVMELFPSKLIHIGGDECPKLQWQGSQVAQQRIDDLGLQDEKQLQSWFIDEINEFLLSRGRRVVGWDEILEGGLARGATVMSWRGLEGGFEASKMGHEVILTPTQHTYLDYYQSRDIFDEEFVRIGGQLPLEKVYEFDVLPANFTREMGSYVMGTQGQIWTEYINSPNDVEWMGFPRICALAEIAWTTWDGKAIRQPASGVSGALFEDGNYGSLFRHKKSFSDFKRRLEDRHLDRLSEQKVNYFRPKKEKTAIALPDLSCKELEEGPSESVVNEQKETTFVGNSTGKNTCGPFYILQHLEDGVVAGKSFETEADAKKAFDEKVCPHFAAIMLSGAGKILDFWGEQKESVMNDFIIYLQDLMAQAERNIVMPKTDVEVNSSESNEKTRHSEL